MAQKLYTKEMFLIAAEKCEVSMIDAKHIMKYIDEYTTPIELPSDEDIIAKSKQEPDNSDIETAARIGYIAGAKWMREKILNK